MAETLVGSNKPLTGSDMVDPQIMSGSGSATSKSFIRLSDEVAMRVYVAALEWRMDGVEAEVEGLNADECAKTAFDAAEAFLRERMRRRQESD